MPQTSKEAYNGVRPLVDVCAHRRCVGFDHVSVWVDEKYYGAYGHLLTCYRPTPDIVNDGEITRTSPCGPDRIEEFFHDDSQTEPTRIYLHLPEQSRIVSIKSKQGFLNNVLSLLKKE